MRRGLVSIVACVLLAMVGGSSLSTAAGAAIGRDCRTRDAGGTRHRRRAVPWGRPVRAGHRSHDQRLGLSRGRMRLSGLRNPRTEVALYGLPARRPRSGPGSPSHDRGPGLTSVLVGVTAYDPRTRPTLRGCSCPRRKTVGAALPGAVHPATSLDGGNLTAAKSVFDRPRRRCQQLAGDLGFPVRGSTAIVMP
jgi:hypothetical protein